MVFDKAKWIWVESESKPGTYGEFYDEFQWEEGNVNCLLSCDGDYTLFVNGKYFAGNQYGDYEWYKSYDSIDITPFLKKGKNSIAVLVWHFGMDSQRYIKAQAGLIFELQSSDSVLLASGENTLARYSKAYKQGVKKLVTRQLGVSFAYDATQEDDWKTTGKGFQSAVLVDKNCSFIECPIEKLKLLECVHGRVVLAKNNHYIIDLGEETVGLISLDFVSPAVQKITVAWGEDLQDGHVRQRIEHRDFSFDYVAKAGRNEYVNYMLRLGCRYIEIYTEAPIKIGNIGLIPQVYPVEEKQVKLDNALDQKIYDACVNMLAILAELELDKEYVCKKIVNGELSDCSLSMKIFKYDVLLATNKEKYQAWVLKEIRREYGKMIEQGDTVWEIIDGASAFDNAGSLCHGWSAIPVYYYTKLKNV